MALAKAYKKTSAAVEKPSPLQFQVTQRDATEPRFRNEFWKNARAGLYVDVVSGEPLFLSSDKFESNSGWPSFSQPVGPAALIEKVDESHGMKRIEVRSTHADSHLGHLFPDGPKEAGGMRYCINSAALRFIPVGELQAEGYGEFERRLTRADEGGEHE
jgi:methionine-R-sulfoxide reductase